MLSSSSRPSPPSNGGGGNGSNGNGNRGVAGTRGTTSAATGGGAAGSGGTGGGGRSGFAATRFGLILSHVLIMSVAFRVGNYYGDRLYGDDGKDPAGRIGTTTGGAGHNNNQRKHSLLFASTTTTSKSRLQPQPPLVPCDPEQDEGNEGGGEAATEDGRRAQQQQRQPQQSKQQQPEPIVEWEIPAEMSEYVGGWARTNRREFLQQFDAGIPFDVPSTKDEDSEDIEDDNDVIVMYDSLRSVPDAHKSHPGRVSQTYSAKEALENCKIVRVVTVDSASDARHGVCYAIQGNNAEPHYHVHKWMRKQKPSQTNDPSRPVQFETVSRYQPPPTHPQARNKLYLQKFVDPPKPVLVNRAQNYLRHYLSQLDHMAQTLKPILQRIASTSTPTSDKNNRTTTSTSTSTSSAFPPNTVIVMICNEHQQVVLQNYVCAARSVGVTVLEKIVVFSADASTHEFVTRTLGLTSFYHPRLYPTADNNTTGTGTSDADDENYLAYGTTEYARFMLAKAWSCHLVAHLGYDFVLHDLDVVPYRADYVEYLVNDIAGTRYPDRDLYFQYDASTHLLQYQPWNVNTGLFYSRHNDRTLYFWSVLIRRGAEILKTKSHQAVACAALSSVVNQYALRVKVLSQESYDFPVGYHFHQDFDYMKEVMVGKRKPYAFHMNWNTQVDEKRRFLQQIGAWYVADDERQQDGEDQPPRQCIVGEPKPVCYYRDKPSKLQECKTYPFVERDVSFW